jgi:hypothetical protein
MNKQKVWVLCIEGATEHHSGRMISVHSTEARARGCLADYVKDRWPEVMNDTMPGEDFVATYFERIEESPYMHNESFTLEEQTYVIDDNFGEQSLADGDYELAEGKAWFRIGRASIRIREVDGDGIHVAIYPVGREADPAIAETWMPPVAKEDVERCRDCGVQSTSPGLIEVIDANPDAKEAHYFLCDACFDKSEKEPG